MSYEKLLSLFVTLVVLFSLAACGVYDENSLTCNQGSESFHYVYNDEELKEYWYNNEKQAAKMFDLAKSAQELVGIDEYIKNTKKFLEGQGGTCEYDVDYPSE